MFLTHAAAPRFLPSGGARGWRALAPPPRPPRPSRWRGLAAGQLRHAASVCVRIKISGGGAYFCVHLTEPGRLGDTSCLGEAGVRLRGQSEDPPSAVCGNVVRFIEARMEGNGNETVGSRLEPGSHAPRPQKSGHLGLERAGLPRPSHLPLTYLSPTYPLSIIYHLSIIYLSITYRSSISTGSASLEDHDQRRTLSPRTGRRGGDSEPRPRRTHGAALCGSAQVWQGRELRESSAKAQRTLAPRQPLCHQS